jgi:dTDP-3-amino-3,4,6-trideoxy-alpha-D-glucose transaminase
VNVVFLDLLAGTAELQDQLDEAYARVRDSGRYILGPEVEAFEAEFAQLCGAAHCVGVASGLDALKLMLQALDVVSGDEVIVPAYTAVATWMAVTSLGATPVGVDVEERTFNVDAQLVPEAITSRTKAIVPVHLFGRPADVEAIRAAAGDIPVVEDAAQAHGARLAGRRVGSLARAAAFSFYPTKNLGALGDGGAVTTDDAELAARVRMLRAYGWRERSVSEIFGVNSRLDELQAALLRVKLRHLEDLNGRRRRLASIYASALDGVAGVEVPALPADESECVWHVYPVRVGDRHAVGRRLEELGIGTLVHYDPLPHLTPAFRSAGWKEGDFPVAELLAAEELSLPMYPQLTERAVSRVADGLLAAVSATLSR